MHTAVLPVTSGVGRPSCPSDRAAPVRLGTPRPRRRSVTPAVSGEHLRPPALRHRTSAGAVRYLPARDRLDNAPLSPADARRTVRSGGSGNRRSSCCDHPTAATVLGDRGCGAAVDQQRWRSNPRRMRTFLPSRGTVPRAVAEVVLSQRISCSPRQSHFWRKGFDALVSGVLTRRLPPSRAVAIIPRDTVRAVVDPCGGGAIEM